MKIKLLLFFLLAVFTTNAQDLMVRSVIWKGPSGNSIDLVSGYEFDISIRNVSSVAASSFNYQYYISDNATLDSNDIYLGSSVPVTGMAPWSTEILNFQASSLPQGVYAGAWWLIVKVDTGNDVAETNEYNNQYLSPFTITDDYRDIWLWGADLNYNTTINEGENIEVWYDLSNYGSSDFAKWQVIKLYFTLHRENTNIEMDLGQINIWPRLDEYDYYTDFFNTARIASFGMPSSFTDATYNNWYVKIHADPNDPIVDIREWNNTIYTEYLTIINNNGGSAGGGGGLILRGDARTETDLSATNAVEPGSISLYPNPAVEQLNVNLPVKTDFKLVVRDANGRIKDDLFYKNTNSATVDVSAYNKGVYLIQVVSEGLNISKKFMRE